MSIADKIDLKSLLVHSGVVVRESDLSHKQAKKKLFSILLTKEREKFFRKKENCRNREHWHLWELFSFQILDGKEGEEAIEAFERKHIKHCYMVHLYALKHANKVVYELNGKYNVSFIKDEFEFDLVKDDIEEEIDIPMWVLENISETECGREFYAFDDTLSWVFIFTHENTCYFYET